GDAGALDGAAILDISNPAGLSRAEFGVCLLIRKGFTSSRISEELNVAKSTVKSHLRNIYSKTDTAGQVDLMYRLLNEPDPQDAVAVA
ncbi:MAG: helix-turn-helix transcriptional regulator, partial [Paracoccaceae bacterium]|nr:helix-turn-helix transcriptional regulator [Paracoccaceae bacterium]